jgi:hypothetical protein
MKPAIPALLLLCALSSAPLTAGPVGVQGPVGALANPQRVKRLEITKPGVYENFIVDGQGAEGNIVKITADDVVLRHCEIHNASGNGVGVFGSRVVIERCHIHHLLKGSFKDQQDAHGITGRWGQVTIRDCEISHISGDCIQFDPDRRSQGTLTVERCTLWTGPLTEDSGNFKKGERPGENALDTKTLPNGPPSQLLVRDCYLHGWCQPAQIQNAAALNLKENVVAEVMHCVFAHNEIALRLRGPSAKGGAHVTAQDCAFYHTQVAVRAEDKIEQLKLRGLAFGTSVDSKLEFHNGKVGPGLENVGERPAEEMELLLKQGF